MDYTTAEIQLKPAEETPLARVVREQGRLKQWVAEQLGCDPSRLSKLLAGTRSMTLLEVARASKALGKPVEYFLPPDVVQVIRPPAEPPEAGR